MLITETELPIEDDQEWIHSLAMIVSSLLLKSDPVGALDAIKDMDLSADEYASFWPYLDSKQRSSLKACSSILSATTETSASEAYEAAPKHAQPMLTLTLANRIKELRLSVDSIEV